MMIINGIATINNVMITLAPIDPPTMAPELGVLVLVVMVIVVLVIDSVLVLVYTSVHSGPVIPLDGYTRFLPTLTCRCV